MNNDLISREALLKAIEEERQYLLARGQRGAEHILVHHCLPLIDNAPTVEQPTGEWCTDCKEFDHEKNCCPRFTKVIRETLKDAEQPTGTWVKLDDVRRVITPIMIDWWRSEYIEYVMNEIEQKAYIWKGGETNEKLL